MDLSHCFITYDILGNITIKLIWYMEFFLNETIKMWQGHYNMTIYKRKLQYDTYNTINIFSLYNFQELHKYDICIFDEWYVN